METYIYIHIYIYVYMYLFINQFMEVVSIVWCVAANGVGKLILDYVFPASST